MAELKDYIEKTIDNRGRNPEYLSCGEYPVIDNVLIKNNLYPRMRDATRYINQDTHDNFLRGYVHKNMPIMTLVGNGIGNVTLAPSDRTVIVQNTIGFQVNEKLDEVFLYYYLLYKQENIRKFNRGSGQPSVRKTDILGMDVEIPTIDIQKRIAKVLFNIDNKIHINSAISEKLSEQFSTLYEYWFTDNQSSEWPKVALPEIIYFQEGPGIRNWQYVDSDGVKFINIRCISNNDINLSTANMISTEEANEKYSHFLLQPYDIVMSCSGTLGRYAIVREEHLPLCLNTSVIRFRPIRDFKDYAFVYGYMTSKEFLSQQQIMANGSAQVNFGPTHLRKIEISEPPIEKREGFYEIAMPIIDAMINTMRENVHLAKVRDTLLPMLMSGELDVSEIEL